MKKHGHQTTELVGAKGKILPSKLQKLIRVTSRNKGTFCSQEAQVKKRIWLALYDCIYPGREPDVIPNELTFPTQGTDWEEIFSDTGYDLLGAIRIIKQRQERVSQKKSAYASLCC